MGFSQNLAGAGLTVAMPLGILGAVIIWGFFGRRPGRSFGGISKSRSLEAAGRPEIKARDMGVQTGRSDVEDPLR